MTSVLMDPPNRRVDMWYSGSTSQRRVTVFFRIFMAIPQLIVLTFLDIAAFFVVFVGWFAALFTGRLPEFAHNYVSGLIRWQIRVGAYLYLLTDSYPPFSLDDEEYPVRIILPGRGPLTRLSVFFRFILGFPIFVFTAIVSNGLTYPLLFVMWFVVLIRGSMPSTLYNTYSAFLRYQARFFAWYNMLTSEYPWGIMGDFVPAAPAPTSPPPIGALSGSFEPAPPPPPPPPPVPGAQPPAQPPAQPFAYPQTQTGEQVPTPPPATGAPPAPPGWPPPQPAPPISAPGTPGAMPPPSPWERTATPSSASSLPPWGVLVVKGAARGWMIFAIVWGSIVLVGQVARDSGHRHQADTTSGLVTTVPPHTAALGQALVPSGPDH